MAGAMFTPSVQLKEGGAITASMASVGSNSSGMVLSAIVLTKICMAEAVAAVKSSTRSVIAERRTAAQDPPPAPPVMEGRDTKKRGFGLAFSNHGTSPMVWRLLLSCLLRAASLPSLTGGAGGRVFWRRGSGGGSYSIPLSGSSPPPPGLGSGLVPGSSPPLGVSSSSSSSSLALAQTSLALLMAAATSSPAR